VVKSLHGRVAVVTGGASGIGLALVKAFLGEGMKVVVADVEEPVLEASIAELRSAGGNVLGVATDVAKPAAVEALAERTYETYGGCHILCNNAGVGSPSGNTWDSTPNDWAWLLGVNVAGVAHGIQSFVPRMLEGGDEGLVINTSSGNGGISPLADASVYAASKAAVSALTECLAAQLLAQETKLRAAIFYPSGGLLKTGIWTTDRNRPAELAREKPAGAGAVSFEEFRERMKQAGMDPPIQDLDELAQFVLDGIRKQDFVIMIGRERMETQLVDRAKKLAAGECPIS
jgi:NAD(P)-dependent dehydrogenase (short-subunit alcohol dehydrogenase family)